MPQKRRRKGEVREQILENLKGKGPLSFTRLKNKIAEASGKPVADKVVWHNLETLREEGKLEKGKKGKWRITESYWAPLARRDLIKALTGEEQRVEIGRPILAPTFSLGGGGRHIQTRDEELDDIAVKTLTEQISGVLGGYSTEEEEVILDFASRSLWNGYCSYRDKDEFLDELSIRFREERYGRNLKIRDLTDLWEVEVLFSMDVMPYDSLGFYLDNGVREALERDSLNLPEHVERLLSMSLAKFLYDGTDPSWGSYIQDLNCFERRVSRIHSIKDRYEIEEKFIELKRAILPKLRLKEFPEIEGEFPEIEEEAYFDLKKVPTDRKKNLKWLREHKDYFLKFVWDVRNIQFAQVVAVGYKKLEHYPRAPDVIRDVEDFIASLKHEWSPLAAIDLKIFLEKVLPNTIYRLEKGKKPRKGKGYKLPRLYALLRDVYEYYPGARKPEWWKKLKTQIEENLKNWGI